MRQLITAINSIGGRTKFSGNSLLSQAGNATASPFSLQVSNNTTDVISLAVGAFRDIGVGYKGAAIDLTDAASRGLIASDTTFGNSNLTSVTSGQASVLINKINHADIVVTSGSSAATAFQAVQTAANDYITNLSTQRSLLGAYQNQIEFTVNNVTELSSNLSAARSTVQDTDYASETASLTKGQILQQAATAMLAQANQMPNVILSLLK